MRLFILLSLCFISCTNKNQKKTILENEPIQKTIFNDLNSFNLKGNINYVTQFTYEIKSFNPTIELGERTYGINEPEFYNLLEFNDKGFLSTGVAYFLGSKDFDFKDEFIYYRDTLLLKKQRYFEEGVTNMQIWDYNFKPNEIEIIGTQKPIHRAGSAYPYEKIILKTDSVGNIVEKIQYSNNLPSKIGYSDYGSKFTYSYDSKRRLIKETKFLGEDIWSIKSYEYNNGLISKMERTKSSRQNLKFEYKYDQKGNWIEKIDFVDDKPKYVTLRTINYIK